MPFLPGEPEETARNGQKQSGRCKPHPVSLEYFTTLTPHRLPLILRLFARSPVWFPGEAAGPGAKPTLVVGTPEVAETVAWLVLESMAPSIRFPIRREH